MSSATFNVAFASACVNPAGFISAAESFPGSWCERWQAGPAADRRVRALRKAYGNAVSTRTVRPSRWTAPLGATAPAALTEIRYQIPADASAVASVPTVAPPDLAPVSPSAPVSGPGLATTAPELPEIARAFAHHAPALEQRLRQVLPIAPTVTRTWRKNGPEGRPVVDLTIHTDPQADQLLEDERRATSAARDLLISAGFVVLVVARCRIRLLSYYGTRPTAPQVAA